MFSVTRQFTFCYGHRLFGHEGKCRNLHGHNAIVQVTLSLEQLNEQGMVFDFSELKEVVGTWLDRNWDHRTLLGSDDPLVSVLEKSGQPLFLTEGNPTAERLAKILFLIVKEKGFPVSKVEFWETEKCFASYSE